MAKWTKETISNEILRSNKDGYVSSADVGPTVTAMARRIFGSFSDACKYSGVKSASQKPSYEKCCVDGCNQTPRSAKSEYCEKHYYRIRRTGTIDKQDRIDRRSYTSNGYCTVRDKDHPLSNSAGTVYQHRYVYYNTHGEGPFNCNWCGCVVTWEDMHVDHVNGIKTDNRKENLVASCSKCNTTRDRSPIGTQGKLIDYEGRKLNLQGWADVLGISRESLYWRLTHGWTLEEALTKGRGKTGPIGNRIEAIQARTQTDS